MIVIEYGILTKVEQVVLPNKSICVKAVLNCGKQNEKQQWESMTECEFFIQSLREQVLNIPLGTPVTVTGRANISCWIDQNKQEAKYKLRIYANSIQCLSAANDKSRIQKQDNSGQNQADDFAKAFGM